MRSLFFLARFAGVFLAVGASHLVAQQIYEPPLGHQDPTGSTGALKDQVDTGCGYDPRTGNGTRTVTDLEVPGALGDYGLDFTRYWNSLPPGDRPRFPAWMPFGDFGNSGWTHSWAWTASEECEGPQPIIGTDHETNVYKTIITIHFPDGHTSKYQIIRFGPGPRPAGTIQDGRCGQPYHSYERTWPSIGHVHDHLEKMEQNGTGFWLHRADGGSVRFEGGPGGYVGTQVIDPHGFKTILTYDTLWRLETVTQEGGRSLTLFWDYKTESGVAPVITRVQAGGPAGSQAVDYTYAITGNLTLATVNYSEGPDAVYTYEGYLLKEAYDPRFAGPMTQIRYIYRMQRCLPHPPPDNHPAAGQLYYLAQPEAIKEERSGGPNSVLVSELDINCDTGIRTDRNGLGGIRTFYYGYSGGAPSPGSMGYELAQVTDFYNSYPRRQNHQTGHPYQVWDGRNLKTELAHADGSGLPSQVTHVSDGNKTYKWDRIDSNGSESRNEDLIPNSHNCWLFSQTDERGKKTTYTRDSRRRITKITYLDDNSTEHYTYNALNQVETQTLPSHTPEHPAIKYFHYTAEHRLESEYNSVDGWNERKEYFYDDPSRPDLVTRMRDGRARLAGADYSVRMEYNGRNQVVKVHYPPTPGGGSDPHVTYGYDAVGNCTSIKDELGHESLFTYDNYRRCTSYTEPINAPGWNGGTPVASRRWDWHYDRQFSEGGLLIGSYTHTSKEWRLQQEPIYDADGHRRMTARLHDLNNRLKVEMTGLVMTGPTTWYYGPEAETHYVTYDGNGLKSTSTDPLGRVTSYEYDNRNRLWKSTEYPVPGASPSEGRVTETLYDETGNKTEVKFPDQTNQRWPNYTASGQPLQHIDEEGNVTDFTYWPWGPMKKPMHVVTHATGTETTTFWHNGLGRSTETMFPDNSYEQITYEGGQPRTFRTRRGQLRTINYDARGRESSHSWSDGTSGIARNWDDASRLLKLSNIFSTIEFSYDDAGQVLREWNTITGSKGSGTQKSIQVQTTYHRYPNGTVGHVQYPNALWVRRDYTARGQLKDVWNSTAGPGQQATFAPVVSYYYLQDGKVDFQNYGNGTQSDFAYDGRGFIKSILHKKGPDILMQRSYERDARDRIKSWQKGDNLTVNYRENGRGDRYEYDDEGQLTDAWYNAINPHSQSFHNWERKDHFDYDALGNRHGPHNNLGSRNWGIGEMLFSRSNNGLNQYSSWENDHPYPDPLHWGTAVYYDDNHPNHPDYPPVWIYPGNGVLMADGWITAKYNALNQPIAIWSPYYDGTPNFVWFGYDPLGRCVKRWVAPTDGNNDSPPHTNPAKYFYYEGWNLIQEGETATTTQRVYVHGNRVDEIVRSKNFATSEWAYHHFDARSHCTMLTDISGDILEQYEYDAFGWPYLFGQGGLAPESLLFGNRFLFTGREWLSDLRIYDFRYRHYQPELGRFLQPDPIQFKAGDYNLYRYCHNDPINRSDPNGLMSDGQISTEGIHAVRDNPNSVIIAAVGTGILIAPVVAVEVSSAALLVRAAMLARLAVPATAAAAHANKLHHIFGKAEHNLGGVVKALGSQDKAFRALQSATQSAVKSQGLSGTFSVVVKVGNEAVRVTGKVINNVARIGTAYKEKVNE